MENYSRDGIPDHLTCLLRNLYAGQEATVRTEHGTTTFMVVFPVMGSYLSPQFAYQAQDTYPSLSEITSKSSFNSNNTKHLTHI